MTTVLQHAVDAVTQGSLYALFALGVAFIFGIVRLINFAHGEFIMMAGYVVVLVAGIPWPVVVLASLTAVVILAVLSERVVFRPARSADPTTVLVIAFSLSVFAQSFVLAIAGPRAKSVDFGSPLTRPVQLGEVRIPGVNLLTIGITGILLIGLAALLRRTDLGRQLRASAEDFQMARMLGVRANRMIAVAFAVSGGLAAVAGLLLTVQTGTLTPDSGLQPVLMAFVATVIGGLGSLVGAVVGGYALGMVSVLLQVLLPPDLTPYRDAFVLGLVIVMLLVRPQGLIPARAQLERV